MQLCSLHQTCPTHLWACNKSTNGGPHSICLDIKKLSIKLIKLWTKTWSVPQAWQIHITTIMWKTRVEFRTLIPKSSVSLFFPPLAPAHTCASPVHIPTFPCSVHTPCTKPTATPCACGVSTLVIWSTYHTTGPGKEPTQLLGASLGPCRQGFQGPWVPRAWFRG